VHRTFCIGGVDQKIDIGHDHSLTALRHFSYYFFVFKSTRQLQGFYEIDPLWHLSQGCGRHPVRSLSLRVGDLQAALNDSVEQRSKRDATVESLFAKASQERLVEIDCGSHL